MSSLSIKGDSSEATLLREAIAKLRDELMQSRENAQKVTDQLNCLVLLVRRAWGGDKVAASQVATVVGAAPPEMLHQDSTEKVVAKYKSRPLQNWARLSLGILNREYEKLELEIKEQQMAYFMSRQEFFNEQLSFHSDASPNTDKSGRTFLTQLKSRPTSGKSRPGSGKKVTIKHLYRNPAPNQDKEDVAGMTWGDLVVKPAPVQEAEQTSQALQKIKITNSPPRKGNSIPDYSDYDYYTQSIKEEYADPTRYQQESIFDGSNIQAKKKRPVSGVQQHTSDKMRSRPKSAVTTAEKQRPLAFETTRPVSAQVKNNLKKDKITNEKTLDKKTRPKSSLYQKRPECIDTFQDELHRMSDMEKEFYKRTEQLQKKIGIPYGGMV